MRLIDAEQIGLTDMEIIMCDGNYKKALEMLIDKIANAPTIEVPRRMRGTWIGTEFDGYADGNPVYYEWKCSACGCVVEDEEPTWNYCPNCGAEMGEQNET